MILVDTGPLVALLARDQVDHARCVEALRRLSAPMVTTWCVLTEAMYLLAEWPLQDALWHLIARDQLVVEAPDRAQRERMRALMAQYRDLPADLADVSLVALAEARGVREIFTLDRRHFGIYRPGGRYHFDLVP